MLGEIKRKQKLCESIAFGLDSHTIRSGLAIAGKLLTYLIFDNEKIAGEAKCIVFCGNKEFSLTLQ